LAGDATIAAALGELIEAASALAPWFLADGVAIGCVEPAEHAAVASLARIELPGSAFGLLWIAVASGGLRLVVPGLVLTLTGLLLAERRP
jgi:hypothetical protein